MDIVANNLEVSISTARHRRGIEAVLYVHRYLPAAAFYFFFNRAGLPLGLFYTSLFAPFLYIWLLYKGQKWITTKFLLALSPFIAAGLFLGLDAKVNYLRSALLMWTAYIAVYAFCWALTHAGTVDRLLDELMTLNFFQGVLALLLRPTPWWSLLWSDSGYILGGGGHVLRMCPQSATEPWAYGQLMLPLLIFASYRLINSGTMRNLLYLGMVLFPFMLCQSFGGISMALAAFMIMLAANLRRLVLRPYFWATLTALLIASGLMILVPNPISARFGQVMTGGDASTNLRAFFAYPAAWEIASTKSIWWGVGLGQMKVLNLGVLGHGIESTLPSAASQTLAESGIFGLIVRFGVELYLFYRTRVFRNPFRLAMFFVAFVSQLTGSYTDDVQSYILWLFAFFPFFDHLPRYGGKHRNRDTYARQGAPGTPPESAASAVSCAGEN